jgi:hypothetical protein
MKMRTTMRKKKRMHSITMILIVMKMSQEQDILKHGIPRVLLNLPPNDLEGPVLNS